MNSDTETKSLLKCISNKHEEIFKFEIENKDGKLQETNFYDFNKNILNFRNRKEIGYEYLVSNREENINSITNSLKYMHRVKKIRSLYLVITGKFNEFIMAVQTLRIKTSKISEYDEAFISKIWEVEKYIVGILNTLLKTQATLAIPSLKKLEFVKSYDNFKKNIEELYNMMKILKDTFGAEFAQNKNNKDRHKYLYQKNFHDHAELILKDLKSDSFNSIDRTYKIFIKKLESLNLLVESITDKNKVNIEITIDCDVNKVDKFLEIYSSYLVEYCDILDSCDELFLSEYNYSKNWYTGSSGFTPLEHAYDDILIAREMKKYLLNYKTDNKDFLIFSQTDYFKNKLSERIKINLNNIIFSTWLKNKFERKITKNNDIKLSDDDSNYIKRIKELQTNFESVFNSKDSSKPKTFQKIIDSLECDLRQNNIAPSSTNPAYENQNINQDQTRIEENSNPSVNNISKDESNQDVPELLNDTNQQSNDINNQENEKKLIKDLKVEEKVKHNEKKNLKDNDNEKIKISQNNEQNPKDGLNQASNNIGQVKTNEAIKQRVDQSGQNEADNKTAKNELNLDESQKTDKENKTKDDANLEENNNEIIQDQDVKSSFLEDYLIYIICFLTIASTIIGVLIVYFSRSQ